MKKKFGFVAGAMLLLASAVWSQNEEPQKMKMLIGGELGWGFGIGTFTADLGYGIKWENAPYAYNTFDIIPVFQFFPLKQEKLKDNLGFEVDARFGFGSNGAGFTFGFTPDFLAVYYFNNLQTNTKVTPFVGAGIGFDVATFPNAAGDSGNGGGDGRSVRAAGSGGSVGLKTYATFKFTFIAKVGIAYDIPNTKVQVYAAEKFRLGLPFGIINDLTIGALYRL